MCRHFAWLGRPRTLAELILEPSYGLPRQAARPRWQNIDLVNRDGFGAGWFPPGEPVPAMSYRRAVPFEADEGFAALAAQISASCVLGAVRGASPGMPIEEAATAPFTNGGCLLSLNGHVSREKTTHLLEPGYVPESTCDAALLATLLWQRLDRGLSLESAVTGLLHELAALDPGACLNLLATDGTRIVATTWAETLCYRAEEDGVLVASEPHDDDPGWIPVPDRHVVVADALGVDVRPLQGDAVTLSDNPLAGDPAA
ncbi:ergothioneine biosynthesis protein EgtC [Actinoallomurus bryophytorum]|uniref:Glutamine amidotransferase n=1 Tax=Actinoallomurus bryophytorum TaxID=1490222 RepID=A0A543CTK8_9ACTN|nr:ergothioneine biosynthesis protein EgtC [Actinoallomurus bryophytorum]TQM00443.1 glutamine amidotransferase [Actinoallomurus bryophytorum]